MSDTQNKDISKDNTQEDGVKKKEYENAKNLTGFSGARGKTGPKWFNRKKVMMVVCFAFAAVVAVGLINNMNKSKKKKAEEAAGRAARPPSEFLKRELENSLTVKPEKPAAEAPVLEGGDESTEVLLPEVRPVSYTENRTAELSRGRDAPPAPAAAQQAYGSGGSGGGGGGGRPFTANRSSLVPQVEGSLFGGASGGGNGGGSYAERFPYAEMPAPGGAPYGAANPYAGLAGGYGAADPYAAQNNQADKKAFYSSDYSGGGITGGYIGEDALWTGTIIPAVLETAVNTDLPGNVLARVSQNIYDSRTGKNLLIPQGSILVAKYNSSISYAQHRVQIVWDLLIRPDGYQVELQGMNGVDVEGMSGVPAEYHENWFEYLKAAGIITMFSIANSKMAEEAAKYGSAEMAAGVTASNAEFIGQTGGNIVARAMNIQPTLTVDNGEKVNVMLNKTVYLPPAENVEVKQKYILK